MNRKTALLLSVFIVAGVGLALRAAPYMRDDAYIYFRYANNIAQGHGLVFNVSGDPVEGFSSPLWQLLVTAIAALFGKSKIPAGTMVLGLIAFLASILVAFRVSARGNESLMNDLHRWWAPVLAPALIALLPTTSFYLFTGLEPFLLLIAVLLIAGVVSGAVSNRTGLIVGLLAVWTRPEALWLPIAIAAQLVGQGDTRLLFRRRTLLLFGSIGVGAVLITGLRLHLFNSLFPNTYYSKQPSILVGLMYAASNLTTLWGGSIALLGALGATFGNRYHQGLFAAGVSWVIAAIVEGGDWMPAGRFLLPALAMFALAAPGMLHGASRFVKHNLWQSRPWYKWILAAAITSALFVNGREAIHMGDVANYTFRTVAYKDKVLSKWLQESNVTSIGMIDIGFIGFETDIEIVDFAGLTDTHIAHAPGPHLLKNFDLKYIFEERQPDIIVIRLKRPPVFTRDGGFHLKTEDISYSIEARIWTDPRLEKYYDFVFFHLPAPSLTPPYGAILFRRKDVFIDPQLVPKDGVLYFEYLND